MKNSFFPKYELGGKKVNFLMMTQYLRNEQVCLIRLFALFLFLFYIIYMYVYIYHFDLIV